MNNNYSKMITAMNALKAYSYVVVGDMVSTQATGKTRLHYIITYNLNFVNLTAYIDIHLFINNMPHHIEIYYLKNKSYTRTDTDPNWVVANYTTDQYSALFKPGGAVNIFDFETWTTGKLTENISTNGSIIQNIGYAPKADDMKILGKVAKVKSPISNNKSILINPNTYLIEFVRTDLQLSLLVPNSNIDSTISIYATLLATNNQVIIKFPVFVAGA